MVQKVTDLSTRKDNRSFQVVSLSSAGFFVRVCAEAATSKNATVTFSDFILDPDDNERAIQALHLLAAEGFPLRPTSKLIFQNLLPAAADRGDRAETVRRHDQIVSVMREFSDRVGLKIKDALLDPHGKNFKTVVLVE